MQHRFTKREVSLAAVAAIGLAAVAASGSASAQGRYVTGDFHNHTTCADGSTSLQKLVNKSVDTFGLDWFALASHGGGGTRNCTLVEDETVYTPPTNPYVSGKGPNTTWADSIGLAPIKGDRRAEGYVYRWQTIQEFEYPIAEQMAAAKGKPIFMALESVVPGHEHTNVVVIDGQLPRGGNGNATAMAQFEYCFDRADNDTSRGGGQGWDCSVPGSALNAALDPTARKLVGTSIPATNYNSGELGHLKSLEGLKWKAAYYPNTSWHVPAHPERAGPFRPTGNGGFNVEHFRDYNNTAPRIAFGMEIGPGYQATGNRSYGSGAVGGGTYGGLGFYSTQIGGLWDSLLGEGRNWWVFHNSDFHSRGSFGSDDPRSTAQHFPGEFLKSYTLVKGGTSNLTPQQVVDGLRSGNSFAVNGDIIDRLAFVACKVNGSDRSSFAYETAVMKAAANLSGFSNANCAQMGEKLVVNPGQDVVVFIAARDPEGTNNSPYSFPNPSLLEVGITQPLNAPVLDHIDLIGGKVTGYRDPADRAAYAGAVGSPAATNPSTAVMGTFSAANWKASTGGWKRMTYRINSVKDSQYVRLRGTNLPAGVPNQTDSQGNPLIDTLGNNIVCRDAACPDHLPAVEGGRRLDFDVEGYTELWFYSNPIFVEVAGGQVVQGVGDRNAAPVRVAAGQR